MKTVRVKTDFGIICFDENGVFTANNDGSEGQPLWVDQQKGDLLELWKFREGDGFFFVYCSKLEIGYWCHPALVEEV
tara:strand:+ start:44 stop:274 length:231 start_codon:yes stop_codon:yes gene_type:complete